MISALATRTSQAPEWAPVDRVRAAPHRAARAHSTRQTNTKHTASPPRQRIREPAPASRREEGDVLREGGGRGAIMAASATRRRHHPSSRPPWAKAARQTPISNAAPTRQREPPAPRAGWCSTCRRGSSHSRERCATTPRRTSRPRSPPGTSGCPVTAKWGATVAAQSVEHEGGERKK